MRRRTSDHSTRFTRLRRLLAILWAAPCSLVGVLLGLAVLALRGSVLRVGPTLEVALRANERDVPAWADTLPFAAITFGHVIVGRSHAALAALRAHERVHVRQYECLGPLFFIAYPASSLLALSRGRCPYRDNRFEREAFGLSDARNEAG
jgi:hypothetical protein